MVALRTLQLKEGREDESRSAALAFSESQQQRLRHLAPKLQAPPQTTKPLLSRLSTLG
jgi:hypothetical protein